MSKTAIVTGSSRGIGRSIALKLAKEGYQIVVNYSGSEQRALEVVEEIKQLGSQAIAVQANVSDADSVKNLIDTTLEQFGTIDVLVNNAGITRDQLLMRMKEDDWDAVIDTNLKSVFLCTKAVARPMMKQRSGRIVNVASVVGIIGNAGQANYTASKAGVIGFTKTTARELASRNILVNAVAPGFIETEMTDEIPEELQKGMLAQIPLNAFGKPEHIADVVHFLVSDASRYMTGQVLHIDGGMVM